MKILFIGEIGLGQTALMRMRALARLGNEVRGVHTIEPWQRASWVQRRCSVVGRGAAVDEINDKVIS